jgi:large subunit ribosomal protein L17
MRHKKRGRKLGTNSAHTTAILRGVATGVLRNDRIKTTEVRAKEVRPLVDSIITWAKKGDVHSRRLAIAALGGDKEVVSRIFDGHERFEGREGGYTRILKLGPRKGDNATMVLLELVD